MTQIQIPPSQQGNDERLPSYYMNIPASVWNDEFLSEGAVLLYGHISTLCNLHGYCYATNKYFQGVMGATKKKNKEGETIRKEAGKRTIQDRLKELTNREHIHILPDDKGKRRIYMGGATHRTGGCDIPHVMNNKSNIKEKEEEEHFISFTNIDIKEEEEDSFSFTVCKNSNNLVKQSEAPTKAQEASNATNDNPILEDIIWNEPAPIFDRKNLDALTIALVNVVLNSLNKNASKNYKLTPKRNAYILTILEQDYTLEDIASTLKRKCRELKGTEYERLLTPCSLFNLNNFDKYINEQPHTRTDYPTNSTRKYEKRLCKKGEVLSGTEIINLQNQRQ